ncbi:hypothetical protein LRAMOSA04188 [Lichtheimia ramosa]|uniref:DUF3020 domain-containing protein n=1 Tax=Lichtheimia ramosa TaxID=688394 RepID=A0A077WYY7_9FUNG|nr:hypothetical protein LRAMOSA04188 [Lichtheimia ramosa]
MENPNIHNIPYVRSRDQKRWKGHSKKVVSKEETTERMRKWRAENREKNRQNDLRCRVYRLARQKFGLDDSPEKQQFVRDEIARRLGRRMLLEQQQHHVADTKTCHSSPFAPPKQHQQLSSSPQHAVDLPFYSAPQKKIELPSISPNLAWRRDSTSSNSSTTSSNSSVSSLSSPTMNTSDSYLALPPICSSENEQQPSPVRYVENTKILHEFVGVVLNYADNNHRSWSP